MINWITGEREERIMKKEHKKKIYVIFKDEGFPYEPNLKEVKRYEGKNAKNLAYRFLKKQGKQIHRN